MANDITKVPSNNLLVFHVGDKRYIALKPITNHEDDMPSFMNRKIA